jgi:hypothetical protein
MLRIARGRWLASPDTGESAYKSQAHRTGNAGCFGVPVVTNSCAFLLAHEAAGAFVHRHSLCPLVDRGTLRCITRAQTRRGNAEVRVYPTVVPADAETHNHGPSLLRESRRTASLNTYDAAYGSRLKAGTTVNWLFDM